MNYIMTNNQQTNQSHNRPLQFRYLPNGDILTSGARVLLKDCYGETSEGVVHEVANDMCKVRYRDSDRGAQRNVGCCVRTYTDWLGTDKITHVLPARPSTVWRVTKTVLRLSWKAALLTLVLGAGAAASQLGLVAKLVSIVRGM
jgi:hypothetical protein